MIVVEFAENVNEIGYWGNESDCGIVITLNYEEVLIETNIGLSLNIFNEHGMIKEVTTQIDDNVTRCQSKANQLKDEPDKFATFAKNPALIDKNELAN